MQRDGRRRWRDAFAGLPRDVDGRKHPGAHPRQPADGAVEQAGALLLTTGNKSELAVGYCTLYGDMSGGLAVIADVPKTMVYRVARWLNDARTRGDSRARS